MSEQTLKARDYAIGWQFALPLFVGAMLFVPMIVAGHRMLNDPDIYWHLVVGQWIASHRALPHADTFSLTMAGQPWIAKEWGSQLIYAAAYHIGGWTGIVIAASAAIGAAFALLARFLAHALSPMAALVLVMAAMLLAAPHLVARPHVLAMPFMIAWVAGLVFAADRARGPSLWLLPLMVAWANLHAGFTLGLALIVPFALDAVLSARARERRHVAMLWLGFAALALIAACLTPYGPQSMLMTVRVLGLGPALGIVNEWKPQDFAHVGAFEIALLGAIGFALHRGLTLPPVRLMLVLGLLHMALAHVRNSELFALLAPMMVARPLNAQLGAYARENRATDIAVVPLDPRLIFAGTILALAGIAWFADERIEMTPDKFVSPAGAVDAIKAAHMTRILNDYDFGGYMVARGLKPFIDGRTELYGGAFTAQHNRAVTLQDLPGLLKLLDAYDIQATLPAPGRPANALLDRLPGWKRLYADDVAVVHIRSANGAATCRGDCAMKSLEPFAAR